MARKKLKLAYITDDTIRRQSFKHRKKGFMKKLDEIKTLCGVDACAVIYNQFNSNPEMMWPSNLEVNNVIEKFETLTKNNQTHRSVNHQEFLNQYIAKVEKKNKKMIEDNNEDCLREVMFKCLGGKEFHMNDNERRDLCTYIDQYLKVLLHHKNVTLNNPHFEIGESSSMAMVASMTPIPALMAPTTNMATNMAPIPTLMAPTTMDEASLSSFLNAPSFTFPQLTNELQSIVSSNQELEQANSLVTNLLPNNDQDLHIQSMDKSKIPSYQSIIPSYQGPEHFNYLASDFFPDNNQEVYIPNEFHYQDQKQNQEKGFVEEMMNYAEQTGFPWMEDTNHYNHNQF